MIDIQRYQDEHCDARPEDFAPHVPRAAAAELTLAIVLEDCADPRAFYRDLEAVGRELRTRWNHEPATEGNGLNLLRSQADGKCIDATVSSCTITPTDPDDY
jgi:hypothetical protein